MRRALLLFVCLCFASLARAQTGTIVLSVTSSPISITVNQNCKYVVIEENSGTPTNAYTITLPGQATGIVYAPGTKFVFSSGDSGFKSGQTLGTISIATGTVQFIGIESLADPTLPSNGKNAGGASPGGSSGNIQVNNGAGGFGALSPTSCGNALYAQGITLNGLAQGCATPFEFDPLNYGAIADGSTNNSTALTSMFTAVNAVTVGFPIAHFRCQQGIAKCQYNYTDGGSTSPIHPTKPTTIWCDPGVTLNDTGSAHMMDLGDGVSDYTVAMPFNVYGCHFISTGTITAAIFLNGGTGYIETGHIENNNFDALPSASTAVLATAGQFSNMYFEGNQYRGEGSVFNLGSGQNNIVTVRGNQLVCVDGSGNSCSGVGGLGILCGGQGSMVTDNTILWFNPLIQITQGGRGCHVGGNYFESNLGSDSAITFGLSGDSTGTITGVAIDHNFVDMHTPSPFIAPASGSSAATTLVGWNLEANRFTSTPNVMVSENPVQGQRYNQANGNYTVNFGNWWTNTVGLTTANAVTPEPWFQADSNSYTDTFHRANGALGGAWVTVGTQTALQITSNVATCSATCAGGLYGNDISTNQRNAVQFGTVPTGTDFVGVYTRFTQAGSATQFTNYQCFYLSGTGIKMVAVVSGSASQLGSTYTAVTPVAGDVLTLESIGAEQTCYLRHTTGGTPGPDIAVIGPIIDSTVAAGYGGIQIGGTSGTISLYKEVGLP